MNLHHPTVAVVTSTIGRPELIQAILSVKNQTYPCKHYIFVDGEQYAEQARQILSQYNHLIVTYLPMNTGANGWSNSSINAIAPYLITEDLICYLDDDNCYEPYHVESAVEKLVESGADYAYALRSFYTQEGEFICPDNFESLGFLPQPADKPSEITFSIYYQNNGYLLDVAQSKTQHIDTNCYILKREVAILISSAWYSGLHNDTNVFNRLIELNLKNVCTHRISVKYHHDPLKFYAALQPAFHKIGVISSAEQQKICLNILQKTHDVYYQLLGKYPWE